MSTSFRFGSAASAIVIASLLGGCATPQSGAGTVAAYRKMSKSEVGLATKAMIALEAKDYVTAIALSERAVQNDAKDPAFRALLGNAYFASGRFGSAEAAYRDSLALFSNQPQVILKLALIQISQGRNVEAVSLLTAARSLVDPADRGLALALAGESRAAIDVLETAAREVGADARVRQNLALAHALAGDWTAARTIAAQDLAPNLVDTRVREWMALAKPGQPSEQVAALVGVKPIAGDPGLPTRLALRRTDTRMASVAPVVPAPTPAADAAPVPVAPAAVAAMIPVPTLESEAVSAPVVANAEASPLPAPVPSFEAAEAEPTYVEVKPRAKRSLPIHSASVTMKLPPARPASLPLTRKGRSTAVVQLGAYGSASRVAVAWDEIARRHASLRPYVPVSARFNSAKGLVYRLSVKGFDSPRDAVGLCASLRRKGTSCFVRSVAGDAPVQIASR